MPVTFFFPSPFNFQPPATKCSVIRAGACSNTNWELRVKSQLFLLLRSFLAYKLQQLITLNKGTFVFSPHAIWRQRNCEDSPSDATHAVTAVQKVEFPPPLEEDRAEEGGLTVNVTPLCSQLLWAGVPPSSPGCYYRFPPLPASARKSNSDFFPPPPRQRQTRRKEGSLSPVNRFLQNPMATQKNREQLPHVVTGSKRSPAPPETVTAALFPSLRMSRF